MKNQDYSDIKIIFFDFDGVFTDNTVYINEKGEESIRCSKYDSYGISKLSRLIESKDINMKLMVLTTEKGLVVEKRCKKLGLEVVMGSWNKLEDAKKILDSRRLTLEQCAFIGNDENDINLLEKAGLSICPGDAISEVKAICDIVLSDFGGKGAVRNVCEIFYRLYK